MLASPHVCSAVYGGAEVLYSPPPHVVIPQAIYVPIMPDEPEWGIYDVAGRVITGALHLPGTNPSLSNFTTRHRPTKELIEGDFLYCGYIHPDFGHFLLSTLSRMWMFKFVRGRKIVYHSSIDITSAWSGYLKCIFEALNLRPDDFIRLNEPTTISNLIVPYPAFVEQAFAHKVFAESCQDIANIISVKQKSDVYGGRAIYLSKEKLSRGVRRLRNEKAITSLFAEEDFNIVYPETMTFEDQIGIWKSKSPVVSFVSSALHTSIFCPGKRVVVISDSLIINSNFVLVDKLSGADVTYLGITDGSFEGHGSTECFTDERTIINPSAYVKTILSYL